VGSMDESLARDVRLRRQLTIDRSDIAPPYDFEFQLRHYVVAPEARNRRQLVEIVRLASGKLVKIDISSFTRSRSSSCRSPRTTCSPRQT
jgi:hypothetical protein